MAWLVWLFTLAAGVAFGQSPVKFARYTLLPDSTLVDDCPPCARPTILEPLRGGFDLRLDFENPLFTYYTLENFHLMAGAAGRTYKITGKGRYRIGGEVALVQDVFLEVWIDDGTSNRLCYLTNATPGLRRLWPMLNVSVVQTNGTFTQVYHLDLAAAPMRELWFSTTAGMTPGVPVPFARHLSGGDLLSNQGRLVKSNRDLTQRLGLMPSPDPPDLGLDAVEVLPGGELVFSIEDDVFSETLGPLHHGDLLSARGRIVQRNQQLTAAFMQMPPAPDAGLDAVQVMADGEVYFSIEKPFFSERLGRQIRAGDLLSSRGTVLKSNEQLLAGFQPADAKRDYGLDAVHVWPSGEVWFSVETGFYGPHFEPYLPGDLLSDQGYVVARNLDLVGPFQPLEDLADFGLDALFIVSDLTAISTPPRFTSIQRTATVAPVHLEWKGDGRVFQVERARDVAGPYESASEIIPDLFFDDTRVSAPVSFYRLQQW